MSRFGWLVALALWGGLAPASVDAAAVLIPDHTFRLGTCGGPSGSSCAWECGVGKGCPGGGGSCALQGGNAFGALLVAKADATPCGAGAGSVLTLGLAGGTFAVADTAFDLCDRPIPCSGRQPRGCNACGDKDASHLTCLSDDGQGNFECPPDNVVFFCKDPCAGAVPGGDLFVEENLDIFSAWFSETRQPLPELIRATLPGAPAVGRPVVYHVTSQLFPSGDPPVTRVCARVMYTSQDRPLGACADDVTRVCAGDDDCDGAPCLDGTPAGVNPLQPDAVASHSVCADGARDGRPCASGTDCPDGSCNGLGSSASSKFCATSLASCTSDLDCPGDTCISCPEPACGDGVQDPGEECDDADLSAGDGCDASCALEPCFDCDAELGEQTLCFASGFGALCDTDGTQCTRGTCDGFGTCTDGGALSGCAGPVPTKAKLKLKRDPDDPTKAKLDWKWLGVDAFDVAALGNPASQDDVTLCLFDQGGLKVDVTAPAGGLCGKKPCWAPKPGKLRYKDKEATPDGVTKISSKSGLAGKGKLQVGGKGSALVLPLPLVPPVRVVAVTEGGAACEEALFSTPDVSDGEGFKAKGD